MKRYSALLTTREIIIKTTRSYHLTSVRTAITKNKTTQIINVGKDVKWEHLYTVCGKCKSLQPLWRTEWRFLKKLKATTIWPSNSTPGYVFEKNKNTNSKRYMCSIIHSSIILVFDTHHCQKSLSLLEVPQLCSQGGAVPEATRVISDTSLGTELIGQEGKSPFSWQDAQLRHRYSS